MACACSSGTPTRLTTCSAESFSATICNYSEFGMDAGDQQDITFSTLYPPTAGRRNDPWNKDEKPSHIRFFNEPIEQIPGYRWNEFQILIHGCKNGLRWWSPVCVEPIICVCTGTSGELKTSRQKMYVISDATPSGLIAPSSCPIE